MTVKIKDKEDGLWRLKNGEEFFMYYKDTFMGASFDFEPVNGSKVVYEGETLAIPYEFL